MSPNTYLLIRAITQPMPQAHAAWKTWRKSTDVDDLGPEALSIIPVLGDRLTTWLDNDSAAGLFRGIVRRAWTETQFRLKVVQRIVPALEIAGCAPLFAGGSLASCLLNRLPNSTRPISDIRFAIHRESLERAALCIQANGWRLSGTLPPSGSLSWCTAVHFSQAELNLMIQWRFLAAPANAALAVEAEFRKKSQSVDCLGITLQTASPERVLLAALCRQDFDTDIVPWQVDAAVLPLERVNWKEWRILADRFAPEAFDRLRQMRDFGLAVPRVTRPLNAKPKMRKLYRAARSRVGRLVKYGWKTADSMFGLLRRRSQT